MIIINADTENSKILPIDRQLEDEAREVWFDLTWLILT